MGWAAGNSKTSLEATFTSLNGKVTIKNRSGKSRTALMTSTVPEGSTVTTEADGKATLKMFDGSTLELKPNTSIVASSLRQPSLGEKILKFRLKFGEIMAAVKKLASAKSSFETDGGGVVCGVRGTRYLMRYNPQTGKVDVVVFDGTVWATGDGKTFVLQGGEEHHFTHGHSDDSGKGNGQDGQQDFNAMNPFYGFDGNETDYFNGGLVDGGTGAGDLVGRVGDDGSAGLGGYSNEALLLLLNFPQYLP